MLEEPNPRHRFSRVLERTRQTGSYKTSNPTEEALVRLLLGEDTVPEEIKRAYRIYKNDHKREVIEAFLLAGGGPRDLQQIFNIDLGVTEVYQEVFFDTEVFEDRLDAEAYARSYPTSHDGGFGYEQKNAAVDHGLEYLKASFGRGNYEVSPTKAMKELISQSYVLSKAATKFPVDHAKAKEARQWAATMINSIDSMPEAQEIEDTDDRDFKIQLKYDNDDETDAVDDEINQEDIVHQQTEYEEEP